jgi:hypothetical protein
MEFLTYGAWLGVPVALAGPTLAVKVLSRWKIGGALAAAFAPTLMCLLLLLAGGATSWGMQRAAPDGDMSNGAAVMLLTFGLFAIGVVGLACGGVVWLVSGLWRRRHAAGVV